MNFKIIIQANFIMLGVCMAFCDLRAEDDPVAVEQIVRMTGNKTSKVARMMEASDKRAEAFRYAELKDYQRAISALRDVTVTNGYPMADQNFSEYVLALIYRRMGEYQSSLKLIDGLIARTHGYQELKAETEAMLKFSEAHDKSDILEFISSYRAKNKHLLPPQGYVVYEFITIIRLLEMANEIDQALELTEQYLSKKSLAWHTDKKTQTGLSLLKQALLRDKQEGKNIYAQELINTTDYFGFV